MSAASASAAEPTWARATRSVPNRAETLPHIERVFEIGCRSHRFGTGYAIGLKLPRKRATRPSGSVLLCTRDGQVVQSATVLDGGYSRTGGQTFDSPSAAAKHALGVGSANGWEEWICVRDGETLAAKRARIGLELR